MRRLVPCLPLVPLLLRPGLGKSVPSRLLMSSKHAIHVTTYNVLSSSLASPDYYTSCTPENLDQKTRYARLLTKLEGQMSKDSIICLQEVSLLWAGQLHAYFNQRGYYLATALYGNRFNGYMGSAMAIPIHRYEITSCQISRVADTKPYVRKAKPSMLTQFLQAIQSIFQPLIKLAIQMNIMKPKFDIWYVLIEVLAIF